MFALSHIYVSTKVLNRTSNLLVFGSISPDVAWFTKSHIGAKDIHGNPKKFFDFIKLNYPDLIDLAIGVRLHSNIDKGADYYSDDNKTGFAKIEGKKIQYDVSKLSDLKSNPLIVNLKGFKINSNPTIGKNVKNRQ